MPRRLLGSSLYVDQEVLLLQRSAVSSDAFEYELTFILHSLSGLVPIQSIENNVRQRPRSP